MRERRRERSGDIRDGREPLAVPLETGEALKRLSEWEVTGLGLHPGGSNYVFVARLEPGDTDGEEAESLYATYKPAAGERPLRDFPYGTLHNRERASFLLAQALGWPLIPPTVVRDGPHGEGSFQLFIDSDPRANFFTLRRECLDEFEPIAMFDVLVHNADRKGGSCLRSSDGRIWAIDQGLTFNPYARRRTVMFEFNGMPYPEGLCRSLGKLTRSLRDGSGLREQLAELLEEREIEAVTERAERMLDSGRFPVLDPERNTPWPFL